MEMQTSTLGLQIPVQNLGKKALLDMDLGSVTKWRAALPMADIGASAKKLFFAIQELNQATVEPQQRLAILELLRPSLQLIGQSLKKHYVSPTITLTKQKLTIAKLADTIQFAAAMGYKTILEETQSNKTNAALAICRIMQYYHMILLRSYQLYTKAPDSLWQELHILYKYAKTAGILEVTVPELSANEPTSAKIIAHYLHALVLAAIDPFQWRQHEQDNLDKLADRWTSFATLRTSEKDDPLKAGLFIVDLTCDLPPNPVALKKINPNKNCITLDLTKLNTHLHKIISNIEKNQIAKKVTPQQEPEWIMPTTALQRLSRNLSHPIARKSTRFVITGQMHAACGLSAAHYYISGATPFAPASIESKTTDFQEMGSLELTEDLTTDNLATDILNLELVETDTHKKIKQLSDNEKFVLHDCSLLDISPTGACIVWATENYPLAKTGEIIALRTHYASNWEVNAAQASWNIGVVRWLKHLDDKRIRVGIQFLAAYATTAGAQIIKNDLPACYFLRCLLLPPANDLTTPATIITPNVPFAEGKSVNLFTDANQPVIKIKLTKQIDEGSGYRQFEYSTEQQAAMVNTAATNSTKKTLAAERPMDTNKPSEPDLTNSFKSIWDEL